MTTENNSAVLPVNATREIVEASFSKELTLIRYTDQLQGLLNYQITSENTNEAATMLKGIRGVISKIEAIHQRIKKPHWVLG